MTLIQAKNLTIGYKWRNIGIKRIASELFLSMKAGELICLIGPNGSGKSTLLKTITGILSPLQGDVMLHETNLRVLSPIERAKHISIVLTNPVLAGQLTVYDVCSLGRYPHTNWTGTLTKKDQAEVWSALETIGIGHFAHRYLHELSDGERQKVMIARALAQDADLIVLDEPTAFLDMPYRIEIMHILLNLCLKKKRGIILSTHDVDLAIRTADKLWVMNHEGEFHIGAPEDMVLNGIISKVFSIGGISYDTTRGRFHIPIHQNGTVRIIGENGTYRFWTERALERIGIISENIENPSIIIEIKKENERITWIIQTQLQTHSFSNLTDGISWIQKSHIAG